MLFTEECPQKISSVRYELKSVHAFPSRFNEAINPCQT